MTDCAALFWCHSTAALWGSTWGGFKWAWPKNDQKNPQLPLEISHP